MTADLRRELEARLIRYAAVDTQSDETAEGSPSTEIQLDLQRMLVAELEEIGAQEVTLTPYGAVLATIPASAGVEAPVLGLLAHVDTALPRSKARGSLRQREGVLQRRREAPVGAFRTAVAGSLHRGVDEDLFRTVPSAELRILADVAGTRVDVLTFHAGGTHLRGGALVGAEGASEVAPDDAAPEGGRHARNERHAVVEIRGDGALREHR